MTIQKIKTLPFFSTLYRWIIISRTLKERYYNPLCYGKYGYRHQSSIVRIPSNIIPKNSYLHEYVSIGSGLRMITNKEKFIVKKYTAIASDLTIVTTSHTPTVAIPHCWEGKLHLNDNFSDMIIEEEVWIGYGVTLLKGAHLGRGCVIGANSMVNKEVPPYAVVVSSGGKMRIIGVKFSIEQILIHEKAICDEDERFTKEYLDDLFEKHYKDLKVLGTSYISEDGSRRLKEYMQKYNISCQIDI